MKERSMTRRDFIRTSTALAGTALMARVGISTATAQTTKRTAADQVTLGKTGIKLSRLGFGTGSNNGMEQTRLGKDKFNDLIHYAYDQGITYFDCAQSYRTFTWLGEAIKGLPREKLYLQSKVQPRNEDVLATIDLHRKTYDTDYIDSLLIHCMTRGTWTDDWKRMMDAYNEAKERKWIRAKGVSCHTLPALRAATSVDWADMHLVRVNPQGQYVDQERKDFAPGGDVNPVIAQVKTMKEKGRGVIGMKIIGNGDFRNADDREKSIRFAMSQKDIDAVVIGFTSKEQISEAIERMNRALAEV